MSAFVEVQFPTDISYGASGGPVFSTDVIETFGGHEQRNINWAEARAKYNVAHGVKTNAQIATLIAFFRARRGKAVGFRFKDWADYQATAQVIGTGDGSETEFQLIKTYTSGGVTVTRTISKPVEDSETINLNATPTTGYTLDSTTGIITFTSPPNNGVVITASFQFDVPVRFDTDEMATSIDSYNANSWASIPLIEIRI